MVMLFTDSFRFNILGANAIDFTTVISFIVYVSSIIGCSGSVGKSI
jgi:hypothetical protein